MSFCVIVGQNYDLAAGKRLPIGFVRRFRSMSTCSYKQFCSYDQFQLCQIRCTLFAFNDDNSLAWAGEQFWQPKQRQFSWWVFCGPTGSVWVKRPKLFSAGSVEPYDHKVLASLAI